MAETETQTQQDAAQERAEAHETGQQGGSTPAATTGAQEANTERDEADPVDQTSDVTKLRAEAAGRRRELRTVEAERDQLRERVDRHDRAEVERLVSPALADPSDVWAQVPELDALREDGAVAEAKVGEALAALLDRKPHFAKAGPNLHQGARQPERVAPSFGAALKGGGH